MVEALAEKTENMAIMHEVREAVVTLLTRQMNAFLGSIQAHSRISILQAGFRVHRPLSAKEEQEILIIKDNWAELFRQYMALYATDVTTFLTKIAEISTCRPGLMTISNEKKAIGFKVARKNTTPDSVRVEASVLKKFWRNLTETPDEEPTGTKKDKLSLIKALKGLTCNNELNQVVNQGIEQGFFYMTEEGLIACREYKGREGWELFEQYLKAVDRVNRKNQQS